MLSNVSQAARVLKKSPKFTASVLLTLALGIGANVAIFSVVSAVLVRRLPIRDPQNVVVVHDQLPTLNLPRTTVSLPQFRDFSQGTDLFESTAVLKRTDLTLTGQGQALRLQGMEVTSQLFSLFGTRPEIGRDFTSQDDTYGSARVVLLSHGFWKRHFGNDQTIIGRELRLNAKHYEIIGVLPNEIEALIPTWKFGFQPYSIRIRYRRNIAGTSGIRCWHG
jgi:hypothetical protein